MDWGFVLGLGVIFVLLITPLIYLGRKLSKSVKKQSPESDVAMNITPTGNALTACLVGSWGACIIAFKLAPNSKFGVFLSTAEGVAAAIVGSILFYAIAAEIAKRFGYPVAEMGKRDTW